MFSNNNNPMKTASKPRCMVFCGNLYLFFLLCPCNIYWYSLHDKREQLDTNRDERSETRLKSSGLLKDKWADESSVRCFTSFPSVKLVRYTLTQRSFSPSTVMLWMRSAWSAFVQGELSVLRKRHICSSAILVCPYQGRGQLSRSCCLCWHISLPAVGGTPLLTHYSCTTHPL